VRDLLKMISVLALIAAVEIAGVILIAALLLETL
jgi:hypothetical protein